MKKRVIAIYLPQFHPFKENDEWWGKGFTEWTNVTKARPRFPGHYQPHLPADLGFYDLRLPEVRDEQAKMAKEAGIYGFCYYHYWFDGRPLMERPLKEVLESKMPNFPFMVCWANENWTRTWNGAANQILIKQNYSDHDARMHIKWLIPYLKDPRYIRINNKPVIAIYRTTQIPNIDNMIAIWREEALKENLHLYICRFESFKEGGEKYLTAGIDAAIEFEPFSCNRKIYDDKDSIGKIKNAAIFRCLGGRIPLQTSYEKYYKYCLDQGLPNYKIYPCVCPMWDNSARRKKGAMMLIGSTPQHYEHWLAGTLEKFVPYSEEENLVFINAWNEWAEGNHIEPDQKWGRAYLDATRSAIEISEKNI